MADVTDLKPIRDEALKARTPWAKRVSGKIDNVDQGEVVEGVWPDKQPQAQPAKPTYDVRISSGVSAKLDHRDPKIPPGMTQQVSPPFGYIAPIKRSVATALLLPYIESFMVELDAVLNRIAERSDHQSDAIPILAEMLDLTREWRLDIKRNQGGMFISHAILLQMTLRKVVAMITARWGEYSAEAQTLTKLKRDVTKWIEGLRLSK